MTLDYIYVIAWSGGYEAPSYKVANSLPAALKTADKWAEDMEESDYIDVLRITPDTLKIDRWDAINKKWETS